MRLYRFMNRNEICLANLALISSRQMHMQQCVHFPRRHNKKKRFMPRTNLFSIIFNTFYTLSFFFAPKHLATINNQYNR